MRRYVVDGKFLIEEGVVCSMKGFWQHENGKVYAIESTTMGEILGAAGPLKPDELGDLEDYEYGPAILEWIQRAIAEHKLHRMKEQITDD